MSLQDAVPEQAVAKYVHCYIKHDALMAQLQAGGGQAAAGRPTLLQWLAAQAGSPERTAPPAEPFCRAFAAEVERVRVFVASGLEQVWIALLRECATLRAVSEELLQGSAPAGQRSEQLGGRLARVWAALDWQAEEVVLLERFLRHNAAACGHLAQLYDRRGMEQGGELNPDVVEGRYVNAAQAALLGGLRVEPLLVGLSDAYEMCRLVESDAASLAGQPCQWVPPDKFERVTRKFWLQPADLTRFKAEVIKHLPILIFGDRRKLTEGSADGMQSLRDQTDVNDAADITSVYYDEPAHLPSYHERLRRDDMASVVRLRWYGERSLAPQQTIYVERKVHRERFVGEKSYKERAPMEQQYVPQYTTGSGGPPDMFLEEGGASLSAKQAAFLREAQKFLVGRQQSPILRTCYRRTAFQESSNNMVRISLDADLFMIRETAAPRLPGDWCRDMNAAAAPGDIVRFPYAVVEIKLQTEPPSWLEGLLQSGMLLPAPKFSKFLHGAALLLQPSCANVPYWFLPDAEDPNRMSPASWEEMVEPAQEYIKRGLNWLYPREADEVPDGAEEEAEQTFKPNPLRFLLGKKAASASAVPGDSASSMGGRGGPSSGSPARGPAPQPVAGAPSSGQPLRNSLQSLLKPFGGVSVGPLAGGRPVGGSPAHSENGDEDLEAGLGSKPAAATAAALPGRGASVSDGSQSLGPLKTSSKTSFDTSLPTSMPSSMAARKGRPSAMVRTRIEPKTFFANERTFLQWLQISVLIMITATSMLSGTGVVSSLTGGGSGESGGQCDSRACFASKLSGAIVAPVGLLFMAYALYMYRRRTQLILRREADRYDDQRGPVLLVVILLACFTLSYVLSLVWMF